MTQCTKCLSRDASVDIKSVGSLCGPCFCGLIERRVKKEVRQRFPFKAHERVLIIDDGSTKAEVMKSLLEECLGGLPLKRELRKTAVASISAKDLAEFDKVLLPLDGDDVVGGFLNWLIKGEENEQKGIPFLSCLLHAEVVAFARSKGMAITSEPDPELSAAMKGLEAKYPGLTHGLLKSGPGFKEATSRNG